MDWKDCKDQGPWDFTEQPDKFGYLNNKRWSSQAEAVAFCQDRGLSLDSSNQHLPCGHWHKRPVEIEDEDVILVEDGKFYCAYPTTGPVYYPANYSVCEIDVDIMQVTKTVELPTLSTGFGLQPRHMAKSNNYLYMICKDNLAGSSAPYLATVRIDELDLVLVDYFLLPNTSDGGFSVVLDAVKADLGVTVTKGNLIVYSHGVGGPSGNEYAVYRKYSIGSSGIPAQTDENLFEDSDYKEAGATGSALVTGNAYTFIGMNTEYGRLVKLKESPFARDSIFDNGEVSLCYGICYDIDNNIVYMAINYADASGYKQKIVKVNALTMSIIDTLVLSSSSKLTLMAMCDHPASGYFYVSDYDSAPTHPTTLYEIRISDFTVNRSVLYRGCTNQANALYVDFGRGFIYYCGGGGDETEYNFYRFDLASFADDLDYVAVADPALHWGILQAQSYCAEVNPLLPGGIPSAASTTIDDEPQVWTMPG